METNDPLEVGSTFYSEQVKSALFKMRVQKEAKKLLDTDKLAGVAIPEGVLADDPLPPEPPELIPGILLTHGATGFIGGKEVGKSLCSLEVQHSLVTGEPLWGAIKPTQLLPKTVHVLAEHASAVLMGLYQRTGLSNTGRMRIFGPEHLGAMKILISNGVRREESVSFYKKLVEGAGLVVFDPLASFIQGQSAENDNAPMRNLIDTMIEIAGSTGAACLILGHQGKPTLFQGRQIKRTSYATRGASATEDALTAVHYLDKVDGAKIGKREVFTLKPIHYKGFKQPPFKLVRDHETFRHTLLTKAIELESLLS